MPHGALIQARQFVGLARYLPRWQQNLLAAALLIAGITLLAFSDVVGIAPLVLVAIFLGARIRGRSHRTPSLTK
jgi:hypothetical protein